MKNAIGNNNEINKKKYKKSLPPKINPNAGNVEHNIDVFNKASSGDANLTSAAGMNGMAESYNRDSLIAKITEFGKHYDFDKYSNAQLNAILNRLVDASNHKKKVLPKRRDRIDIKSERHIMDDDPRYNFDDPDREGEYRVENLREALNRLDHYCIDNDKIFYDLRSLYENIQHQLTPQEKQELKKLVDTTNDPDTVKAYIDSKDPDKKNEELDEAAQTGQSNSYRRRIQGDTNFIIYDMWNNGWRKNKVIRDYKNSNYKSLSDYVFDNLDNIFSESDVLLKIDSMASNYKSNPQQAKKDLIDYYKNLTKQDLTRNLYLKRDDPKKNPNSRSRYDVDNVDQINDTEYEVGVADWDEYTDVDFDESLNEGILDNLKAKRQVYNKLRLDEDEQTNPTGSHINYDLKFNYADRDVKKKKLQKAESVTFNLESIPAMALQDYRNIKYVDFKGNPTIIGRKAFMNCTGLTDITLPASIHTIENEAFRGCSNLEHLTIPNTKVKIGKNVFEGCTKLVKNKNESLNLKNRYNEAINSNYRVDTWIDTKDKITPSKLKKEISSYPEGTYLRLCRKGAINAMNQYTYGFVKVEPDQWVAYSSIVGLSNNPPRTDQYILELVSKYNIKNLGVKINKSFSDNSTAVADWTDETDVDFDESLRLKESSDNKINKLISIIKSNLNKDKGYKAYYELEKYLVDNKLDNSVLYDLAADFKWDSELDDKINDLARKDGRYDLMDLGVADWSDETDVDFDESLKLKEAQQKTAEQFAEKAIDKIKKILTKKYSINPKSEFSYSIEGIENINDWVQDAIPASGLVAKIKFDQKIDLSNMHYDIFSGFDCDKIYKLLENKGIDVIDVSPDRDDIIVIEIAVPLEYQNRGVSLADWDDETDADFDESLNEDTIKQGNKWVNKGKEGTHGKFKTKKAADAQRKAMFANGYKGESLDETDVDFNESLKLKEYSPVNYTKKISLINALDYTIPYSMRYKEADIVTDQNGKLILYWVTEQPFTKDELDEFAFRVFWSAVEPFEVVTQIALTYRGISKGFNSDNNGNRLIWIDAAGEWRDEDWDDYVDALKKAGIHVPENDMITANRLMTAYWDDETDVDFDESLMLKKK